MRDKTKPYNDLPQLPPAIDVESKAVLKACVAARAALAELRMADQILPNPDLLVQVIPLLEARASSEIENIVTTNDALFRQASLQDDDGDPAAKEALRYREALYHGVASLKARPLSTRTAVEVCSLLKGTALDIRSTPGTALANAQTREVIYTPPEGEDRLRGMLANADRFWHEQTGIDPVVRMAILHYQFEAIHPFIDGTGRTGRILNVLCLIEAGLIDRPTLYLSRYILANRADYYRLLARVTTDGDWEAWIVYVLTGITQTAQWTNRKTAAIRALMNETLAVVQRRAPKIYTAELVTLIFNLPYCRIANLVEHGIAKRQAASTYLKTLTDIGVLEERKVGRDKLFLHVKYAELLYSETHEFAPYPNDP